MDRVPYELIAAYLSGDASREQADSVEAWAALSPRNKRVFMELSTVWMYACTDRDNPNSGKEETLAVISRTVRKKRLRNLWWTGVSIVALVAASFLAGSFFVRKRTVPNADSVVETVVLRTASGQKAEALLPDGTHIWLHSGTTVSYLTDYGGANRTVSLQEGEAYFDVAKHHGSKFHLKTPYGDILVYGTKFDVRAYAEDSTLSVVLEEGSVEVLSGEDETLARMVPNQKFQFDPLNGSVSLTSCEASRESVWRFGELKVESERLSDVIRDMERWYGVDISLEGSFSNNRLYWMTVKTESLREMLELLDKITPIRYEINGKDVKVSVL